jgi:hypothetical protein
MNLHVEPVLEPEYEQWDKDVGIFSEAGPYHLSCWHRIFTEVFSVKPVYWRVYNDASQTAGLFAGYFSQSFFTGRHITSVEGGILAIDEDAVEVLFDQICSVAGDYRANYVLLRGGCNAGTPTKTRKTVHPYIDLQTGTDYVWNNVGKNMRNQLRKSCKSNYTVKISETIPEAFFPVFARVQRDLGTPVVSRHFFTTINRYFKNSLIFAGLYKDKELAGGMICLHFRETLYSLYAATHPSVQRHYGNYRLYWDVIKHAASMGCRYFDMGRSIPQSGAHSFKSKWRPDERYVSHHYYDIEGRLNGEYGHDTESLAVQIWKRLPLSIACLAGPYLRRQLPFG